MVIDNPQVASPLDIAYRFAQTAWYAGPAQQKMIEFTAANSETDRVRVTGLHQATADESDTKTANRLKNISLAVVSRIQLKLINDGGSYPSRADFVAGKYGLIHDDDI